MSVELSEPSARRVITSTRQPRLAGQGHLSGQADQIDLDRPSARMTPAHPRLQVGRLDPRNRQGLLDHVRLAEADRA